jgi:serine protease
MAWLRTAFMGLIGLWLLQVLADDAYAQDNSLQRFVPGELIIGYNSSQERDDAIRNINEKKDTFRVRGANPVNTQVKKVGENGLVLRLDFPEAVKRGTRSNPVSEYSLLEEAAKQLKESDPRVKYAHPNWIMRIEPPMPPTSNDKQFKLQNFEEGAKILPQSAKNEPNDPLFGLQWHYQPTPVGMNAIGAWELTKGSKDIVVAVLDTGIAENNDIKNSGNVLPGYDFVSRDMCGTTIVPIKRGPGATDKGGCTDAEVSEWHGTHVAGTIGAVGSNNGIGVAGVAWNVTVLPVRVLGPHGGSLEDIIDAMSWAAGLDVPGIPKNERNEHPANIINMSLGITLRIGEHTFACTHESAGASIDGINAYIDAIESVRKQGVVVVASAGNGEWLDAAYQSCSPTRQNVSEHKCNFIRDDVEIGAPGGCPGVISVAASDHIGHLTGYSGFGNVTIMAPGGDPEQTMNAVVNGKEIKLPYGVVSSIKNTYDILAGTSMAAPHVSGALALALAYHPEWRGNPDLIERMLRASAVAPVSGACPKNRPCGPGQLDARKLLEAQTPPAANK